MSRCPISSMFLPGVDQHLGGNVCFYNALFYVLAAQDK